jgi:glycosyltransferase involved in cell wall biosynthesis
MRKPRVSVLVVARDEADNLADCLAATRWADERVVVVDAASRDATLEIARRDADLVAVRAFDDFAAQRNAALGMATGDWVLSVDADERITPKLADEIRGVIADADAPHCGYRVPIRSEILGRPFAFSGTQHDHPLRLFRRDSGRWVGLVHETVELEGSSAFVRGELTHRTIPTMSAFLDKINRYTTLEAEGLAGARRPFRAGDLTVRPIWTFFKLYVLKQGFRDGVEGFVFCLFSGVSAAVRAWKHRELTLARRAT